ncbi:hypothetical protein [Chitinophaga rhizophila]|uniref:Auto-transporter adhesin head GIN domain-containing protein n=1 Tax=Chitinophaga rhizophila TaxID=2866212 RepID=A0ABS7G577_9BACT|nr:hypothetical protein [Chitinophaga rhizophila]MBW8682810.1 hypothetical protein [Chitinophaga rhizophila]
MKRSFLQLCTTVTLVAALFTACSKQGSNEKTDDVKPEGSATVNYQIQAVNPAGTVVADGAGAERLGRIINDPSVAAFPALRFDLTWDSIKVRFRELKFVAQSGADEINMSIKTDRFIDILDSTSLGSIVIPVGNFDQVKVYLRAQGDKQKPAIMMKGRITWEGNTIPVEVVIAGKLEFNAEGEDVAIGADGLSFDGKLKLDLNLVLTKLQIGDFTGSFTGGKLVLTIDADVDTNNRVKSALESSLSVEHRLR